MKRRESPGRKKPKKRPDSAKTISVIPAEAQGPSEVRKISGLRRVLIRSSTMGELYVVATPIGNLDDITIRAIKTLLNVQVIACEDTRRTGQLVKILDDRHFARGPLLKRRLISVRDWNEGEMTVRIIEELAGGDVALVSDAGTPLISDPGYKIVRAVRSAGFNVVPIPGPSAVTAALSAAGLPTNKFVFWGFWSGKFELIRGATNVIYESGNRTDRACRTIRTKYADAMLVIAQELTKIHESIEEYREGMKFKGEVTILVWLPDGEVGKEVAADHGNGDRETDKRKDGGGNVG